MASVPNPKRINVPTWTALMRKFRGDPDAASQFAEALDSELSHLVTREDLKALELRMVRWMIAIGALIIAANAAIEKLT